MYDPDINDNYYEWIELYNPTNITINLSGWTITDNYEQENLEGDFDHGNGSMEVLPFGYVIITDHGTKIYENSSIPNETTLLYIDDSSIGNGLGNSGDKLILKNETGTESDSMEWIIDYEDVPGLPACSVLENHSLSRYKNVDTNNTSADFYESSSPTIGAENKIELKPIFVIDMCPEFVPKVENDSIYGPPFAIKIKINNYPQNESYQLKAYVIGNESSSLPATLTWNGTFWEYSNYYTSNITTDSSGNWSGWQYLRFKKEYKEYEENIKENSSAYLKVKIKKDNSTSEISKPLFLLDLDDSTSNATAGGYITGILSDNNTFLKGKTAVIENNLGNITGVYLTEDNQIDDDFVSIPGYFKLTSPVGTGYTIKFLEDNGTIINITSNVTIMQGRYKVDISSLETSYYVRKSELLNVPLNVKNIGDFNDTIDLKLTQLIDGWKVTLDNEKINIKSKENADIDLQIEPFETQGCLSGKVTILATSENDAGEFDEVTISFEILGPDLTLKDLKLYNEQSNETNKINEGEIVKIKASLKNIGKENATNVDVSFYYDFVDEDHFIGNKSYDFVDKYQKYPQVIWDTVDVQGGPYSIFVIVDEEEKIDELDESNNQVSIDITIRNTPLSECQKEILITELFYSAHSGIDDEYICISNPSSEVVDISEWYITNNPSKTKDDQTKIVFPENLIIFPNTSLYLTENASDYFFETGKYPDFEYNVDSKINVPQMVLTKNFTLSNSGGGVALKDHYNHTIDIVVYGNSDYNFTGWESIPVPPSHIGVIIKRNLDENDSFIDTNCSSDWINPRRYGIGQSDFSYVNISFSGEIKTFVSPDCSYKVIVDELKNAKESVYLNMYEFTNPYLSDELISALLRNVSVNILMEGSPVGGITDDEKYLLSRIANYKGCIGFIVNDQDSYVYKRYIFDHAKYIIIDNETVVVESCNWAKSGVPINPTCGNREWGIVIKNQSVAQYYLGVFLDDWDLNRCDIYSFEEMNFKIPDGFYADKSVYKGIYENRFEPKIFTGDFSARPVFSPDTSCKAICDMIDSANDSIYVEQLYIYKNWGKTPNPFVERLINKSHQGLDVKVILNYNQGYDGSNDECNLTKQYLEENGIKTKFFYSNWSIFSNIHNKGMIVDNTSVLISSINWNENSVVNNREAGVILSNKEAAEYFTEVFFYDWNLSEPKPKIQNEEILPTDYKNTIYIVIIFTITFALIVRDWRKRQWT